MIKTRYLAVAATFIMVSAEVAAAASSGDLEHTSLEMTRSDGGRARLVFMPNHKVSFEGVKTADVMTGDGTYTISPHQFCYTTDFPGHECWILDRPLHVGDAVAARSTTGSLTATLTLRNGDDAVIPGKGA